MSITPVCSLASIHPVPTSQPVMLLTYPVYYQWYRAILENNATHIEEVVKGATEAEGPVILNGRFVFDQKRAAVRRHEASHVYPMCRPLCLAASVGACDVIRVLIKHGCDIYVKDTYGKLLLL